ncbi:MAG: quinol:electron acceptor oxidoreductase subunit ActD [Chloroflexota bacterium]
MTESKIVDLLAVFPDLEPAANAIEHLRSIGIHDECMNIISGIPVTEAMLGRPHQWTNIPRIAMGGAILGFGAGFFLAYITPYIYPYPIQVSTQSFIPGPPTVVVLFELTMLGMLLSTFLGVFLDSFFPNYRPMKYVPEVSDGKIAILVECSHMEEKKVTDALTKMGAESVKPAEAQHL